MRATPSPQRQLFRWLCRIAGNQTYPLDGIKERAYQRLDHRSAGIGQAFGGRISRYRPFHVLNNVYGYSSGDNLIRILAQTTIIHIHPARDFVGHIGVDSILVLFCSEDWEDRCRLVLEHFTVAAGKLYLPEHLLAGGYETENR